MEELPQFRGIRGFDDGRMAGVAGIELHDSPVRVSGGEADSTLSFHRQVTGVIIRLFSGASADTQAQAPLSTAPQRRRT
jgi:hypothetical protein